MAEHPLTKFIPNLITLMSLIAGISSIKFSIQANWKLAVLMIMLAAFFDFFDGLAARLLNISGELGKQLDSMADMVTFGVAPGFVLYHSMYLLSHDHLVVEEIPNGFFFPELFALLIPIFSAYRLANFNTDTRQTTSFIGLPTPVLAIFIASIPFISIELFILPFLC